MFWAEFAVLCKVFFLYSKLLVIEFLLVLGDLRYLFPCISCTRTCVGILNLARDTSFPFGIFH